MNYLTPDMIQQLPKWILLALTILTLITVLGILALKFINQRTMRHTNKQLRLVTERYNRQIWYPNDALDNDPEIQRARKQCEYSEALHDWLSKHLVPLYALLVAQSICVMADTQFSVAVGLIASMPVYFHLRTSTRAPIALRASYATTKRQKES